jgi:hypothetical protein
MRNGVSEGRAFLEVMWRMKVEPDLISYNTMLDMTAKEIGVKGKVREALECLLRFFGHFTSQHCHSLFTLLGI